MKAEWLENTDKSNSWRTGGENEVIQSGAG